MANECLPIVLRLGDAVQQGTIFPFQVSQQLSIVYSAHVR